MDRPALTPRQQQVLKWIAEFITTNERSPTLLEIGNHFRMKPQSADNIVRPLLRKGYLATHRKGPVRTLVVINDEGNSIRPNQLPVIGQVAAGLPLLAVENRIGYVSLDETFSRRGATFALVVKGKSMLGAGILPGDKVIVRQQPTADKGKIVVALINDEATVKRYFPQANGKVRLKAENPDFQDIIVAANECSLQGIVIGVHREVA